MTIHEEYESSLGKKRKGLHPIAWLAIAFGALAFTGVAATAVAGYFQCSDNETIPGYDWPKDPWPAVWQQRGLGCHVASLL